MKETELKYRLFDWLMESEEEAAAEFLHECELRLVFVDIAFEIFGGEREITICDVNVETPAKFYKNLDSFKDLTIKIGETIRELSITDDIHIRNVHWVPGHTKYNRSGELKNPKEIVEILNEGYVKKQLLLMQENLDKTPHVTIGIAKELLETICKTILKTKSIEIDKNWDIGRVIKETNKSLNFIPDELKDKEEAERSILKVLGGFSSIVQGITELRNNYGSGHGHESDFQGLDKIYAKLVADSSSELSLFYLKIHEQNKKST